MQNFYNTFKAGEFVIVFDEEREIEADFFCLADKITPEKINFLLTHGKGQICVASSPEILQNLEIPLLCAQNENHLGTNFAMPVDAAKNITTGVSAFDRAHTIKLIANPNTKPTDLVRPGHSSALYAQDPKKRWGHTEASVELAKFCKANPVVVICEILSKKGAKATWEDLEEFDMPKTTLKDLKKHLLEEQ